MNKEQKSNLISALKEKLSNSSFVAIVHYRGLSDKELYDLRTSLKSKDCNIKVVKNTLLKIAVKDTGLEALSPYLEGPTAVLYSQDPVILAKIISDTAKQTEFLKIRAGFFNESLMTKESIEEIAKLGSFEDVRASFIGLLKSTKSKFVKILNAPGEGLATLKA